MGWILLGAILIGTGWAIIDLVRSLERERVEAQRLRKEADLKAQQTAVILEPRTTNDAIDRLDRGDF